MITTKNIKYNETKRLWESKIDLTLLCHRLSSADEIEIMEREYLESVKLANELNFDFTESTTNLVLNEVGLQPINDGEVEVELFRDEAYSKDDLSYHSISVKEIPALISWLQLQLK